MVPLRLAAISDGALYESCISLQLTSQSHCINQTLSLNDKSQLLQSEPLSP